MKKPLCPQAHSIVGKDDGRRRREQLAAPKMNIEEKGTRFSRGWCCLWAHGARSFHLQVASLGQESKANSFVPAWTGRAASCAMRAIAPNIRIHHEQINAVTVPRATVVVDARRPVRRNRVSAFVLT